MGLDLSLVPINHHGMSWWLATNRMDLERSYALFEQIAEHGRTTPIKRINKPHPLPPEKVFDWYGDEGVSHQTRDPYGTPLTYLTAGELAEVDTNQSGQWNKAVFEMIKHLPPETPVVLWWH